MSKASALLVVTVVAALGLTGCETTKQERHYHEYVVIEKGGPVRHHHHHEDGKGGRKTYHVYEVEGSDGKHVHHHYVELTPKQAKDLRLLHDQKHADHHGRAVRSEKTHQHRHSR